MADVAPMDAIPRQDAAPVVDIGDDMPWALRQQEDTMGLPGGVRNIGHEELLSGESESIPDIMTPEATLDISVWHAAVACVLRIKDRGEVDVVPDPILHGPELLMNYVQRVIAWVR
eukprot:CAMPEP_0170612376 /NCGR_PEP_ID=MMETSP0224-20130122/23692_1 /TAXON_ID=285029 /ORGANISM="Togula jolla, Strain CCCM 725" /LENGTH=115 /DNA_ID=CAMNT_0010937879 /DNA_START=100 /DNA_END=447 /DNA_ORIENTATION=-